jgi:uncharacterized membrane-anchored protein
MQQILGNTLITLDDNIQIKMFKLQSKTMKLKLLEDYRLIEDARKVINNPVTAASATIEMTKNPISVLTSRTSSTFLEATDQFQPWQNRMGKT